MLRKRKENGTELIRNIMDSFGVPNIDIKLDIPKENLDSVRNFIMGRNNLIVMGNGNYPICAHLMKLRYVGSYDIMKWIPQSSIDDKTCLGKEKVRAIVNLHESSGYKKAIPGYLLNKSLLEKVQVLIGCESPQDLRDAFPYDLDTLEHMFDLWKIGD